MPLQNLATKEKYAEAKPELAETRTVFTGFTGDLALCVGLEHEFYFPFHIWDLYGMSSFPLTNSYFSEG
jgi:hypothetical protein